MIAISRGRSRRRRCNVDLEGRLGGSDSVSDQGRHELIWSDLMGGNGQHQNVNMSFPFTVIPVKSNNETFIFNREL